jgi:hypothetical protein
MCYAQYFFIIIEYYFAFHQQIHFPSWDYGIVFTPRGPWITAVGITVTILAQKIAYMQ